MKWGSWSLQFFTSILFSQIITCSLHIFQELDFFLQRLESPLQIKPYQSGVVTILSHTVKIALKLTIVRSFIFVPKNQVRPIKANFQAPHETTPARKCNH